ncbi:uncharacterized protein TNCV_534391 [Trichonephila clavipes]|nr:uncharacterized protein TNCV_534391 [Trichonephila clavipes]
MSPESRCMRDNTCDYRISWTYHRAVMVPRINTTGDRVLWEKSHHTVTPAVGAVCRCTAKAILRRSPRGLNTRTRLSSLLRCNLDSSLKTTWFHSAVVQFPRARHHSKRRCRWVVVKGSTRNGHRYSKCPSTRCLRKFREDTGVPNEGATCAWMSADEVVGCTRAFLTMWWSFRRQLCRGRPEPGRRVNDISWIHCSQHLLKTQSEQPIR